MKGTVLKATALFIVRWFLIIFAGLSVFAGITILMGAALSLERANWGDPYVCTVSNASQRTDVVSDVDVVTADMSCPGNPTLSRPGRTVSFEASRRGIVLVWVNSKNNDIYIADGMNDDINEQPWDDEYDFGIPLTGLLAPLMGVGAAIITGHITRNLR